MEFWVYNPNLDSIVRCNMDEEQTVIVADANPERIFFTAKLVFE